MAANGVQPAFAPSDVLAAVMTMRSGEQDDKTKAHHYLERFQKSVCAPGWPRAPTLTLACRRRAARFLGNRAGHTENRDRARGRPLRRHHSARQGRSSLDPLGSRSGRLTSASVDVRPLDANFPGRASRASDPDPLAFEALRRRPETNQSPALRMPGHPGHTDEGVGRRASVRGPVARRQRREPCLHPRLPSSAPRRGDRGSENHLICT